MATDRLLTWWAWLVDHSLCPCALNGPEWAVRLCGDIDYYAWRSGFWSDDDGC